MSRACTTPITASTDPSATGRRVCGVAAIAARTPASSSVTSSHSTSVRGVITSRTGRSASRTTPEMIERSCSSITPDRLASATSRCSSSAVTRFSDSRFILSSLKISPDVVSSSHTNGAVIRDSHSIGTATSTAIGSGLRSANCLGTSSPITRLAKVVTAITSPKPTLAPSDAGTPSSTSRSPTGPPRLAPE